MGKSTPRPVNASSKTGFFNPCEFCIFAAQFLYTLCTELTPVAN